MKKISMRYRALFASTVLFGLMLAAGTALGAPPAGFSMQISFTNLPGGATLTNFPALVKLNSDNTGGYGGFLDTTDGYDLRFWTNDTFTGTELNYEVESFNSGGNSYIWVQVPELTQGSSIWATWGDENYNNQRPYTTNGDVWSEGYVAVWHMGEASGVIVDSTSNGFDGTRVGSAARIADGSIGYGQYTSNQGGFNAGDIGMVDSGKMTITIEAWCRSKGLSFDWAPLLSCRGAIYSYGIVRRNSNSLYASINAVNGGVVPLDSVLYSDDIWMYVAATYDGNLSASNMWTFLDGEFLQKSHAGGAITGGTYNATVIGFREDNPPQDWDGDVDEVRVSSVARSTNWIWACYMNAGTNHSSFVEYGSVTLPDLDLGILSPSASGVSSNSATLSAMLLGTNAVVTAYWDAGAVSDPATHPGWEGSDGPTAEGTGAVTRTASSLTSDTVYSYAFYATNSTLGTGVWSTVGTFLTHFSDADAPVFTNVSPDLFEVTLGWTDNASNETAYLLQRSTNGTVFTLLATLGSNTTSYTDRPLTLVPTTYTYRLAATNANNGSSTAFALCETNVAALPPEGLIFYESFEVPDISGGSNTDPTGWTPGGTGGLTDNDANYNTTPYGSQSLWLNGGATATTTGGILSDTLKAYHTYTLSFNIARRGTFTGQPIARLLAGAETLISITNAAPIYTDFSESVELVFIPDASHAALGQTLAIQFSATAPQPHFDNVMLRAVAPPPAGTVLIVR